MQKPELHISFFFIWGEQWRFQPPLPPAPTKLINQQPPPQTYAWRISYDWNTCYNDLENVHNLYIIEVNNSELDLFAKIKSVTNQNTVIRELVREANRESKIS